MIDPQMLELGDIQSIIRTETIRVTEIDLPPKGGGFIRRLKARLFV